MAVPDPLLPADLGILIGNSNNNEPLTSDGEDNPCCLVQRLGQTSAFVAGVCRKELHQGALSAKTRHNQFGPLRTPAPMQMFLEVMALSYLHIFRFPDSPNPPTAPSIPPKTSDQKMGR